MGVVEFRGIAQALGASLLYAPVEGEETLVNHGALATLPAGALVNGALMNAPGLIYDGAAVLLDGATGYIDTGWKTRTNLAIDPLGRGTGFWVNQNSGDKVAGVEGELPAALGGGVGKIVKVETGEPASNHGVRTASMVVPASTRKDCGIFVKGPAGRKMAVLLQERTEADAAIANGTTTFTATGEWQWFAMNRTFSATGVKARIIVEAFDSEPVFTFYVVGGIFEEGRTTPITEGEYFPTPAQITEGIAGFSGEANKSASDIGPFVRGNNQTFFGAVRVPASEPAHNLGLFGASVANSKTTAATITKAGKIEVSIGNGTEAAAKSSTAAVALDGGVHVFAIVWEWAVKRFRVYWDGAEIYLSLPFTNELLNAGFSLALGVFHSLTSNNFAGQMLPFGVFPSALTGVQVVELTAAATSEPSEPFIPSSRVTSIFEPQSGRLAFYLRRPDGTTKRIAGDEVLAENVGQNFSFGTAVPGGYTTASVDFTRDPRVDYGDFEVYDEFLARGPGNESAFEGYDIEIPQSSGGQTGLVAAGWSSYLKDRAALQEIYIDRDMSRVTAPSSTRMVELYGASLTPVGPSLTTDPSSGLPTLALTVSDSWVSPFRPICEAWYDAGPSARVAWMTTNVKAAGSVALTDAAWKLFYVIADTMDFGTARASQQSAVPLSVLETNDSPTWFTSPPGRYLIMQWYYSNSPAGASGASFTAMLRNLIVIGDHGLPITAGGILASDVIGDVIRRCAPLLNYSIEASSFLIPHLIFPTAVNAEEAILQASKYDVPDWGVYDEREFFWRAPATGRIWEARESDAGTELVDAGDQAEDVYNGVEVEFTDPTGRVYRVGPPGAANCDYTDASLADYRLTNPLNEHGRTRYGVLSIGPVTTLPGAIQLGSRWLQDELSTFLRGTAAVTGFARDNYGVYEPVWKIRAGDTIRFDGGVERRIIATTYSHEERQISLTLDSTPNRVDALMAKMEVELVAIGSGS